jgi:myo-inositol 2-dehydrogenase/D-chiro-inositol 1-dehydrogenase
MERYTDSFVSELKAFVQAVVQNKPVPVNGTDGRIAVVMALAARKSFDERRPVQLKDVDQMEALLA